MSAALDLIKKLPAALNSSEASGTNATIQFNLAKPAYITISNGTCTASEGSAASSDVAITMEDEDFIALMKGELNGMTAFMTGKLQLDGDMMLAQRMGSLFDASKLG
jgi:putative sterol carrier protein